jgi:NAD(P)H-dependent FMN reductase
MASRQAGSKYGSWIDYGSNPTPIAAVLANHFGASASVDKKKLAKFALDTLKAKPKAGPAATTPEETRVKAWVDAVRHTEGLWWDGGQSNSLAIGNRVYQESYGGGFWNSYDLGARKQGIHGYQFRAPGEWFAELYAAYYADKLKPSHPIVAELTKLEAPK